MANPIVPYPLSALQAPDAPACPHCAAPITAYASGPGLLTCSGGHTLQLSPDENRDYLDATLGLLPSLDLSAFLAACVGAGDPPPTSPALRLITRTLVEQPVEVM